MRMTFKPMTYLVSFALFVLLFMALGGYAGYTKIADHFLAQAFLDATPINGHVQLDAQGPVVRWEDRVLLRSGGVAVISASSRVPLISIQFPDDPGSSGQASSRGSGINLAVNERTEDLRIDREGRYLYVRVLATSNIKAKESTWLYKYDLQRRRPLRTSAVNPITLPTPFRP
jgi:hypothetical protein